MVDMDAALMAKVYGLEDDIHFMSPIALHKPYIKVQKTTAAVYTALTEDVANITVEYVEKINWIKDHAEKEIDFDAIEAIL
jgi:hypothetical protein